jgi:N-acetylmuramoyl-L-alanine amidase
VKSGRSARARQGLVLAAVVVALMTVGIVAVAAVHLRSVSHNTASGQGRARHPVHTDSARTSSPATHPPSSAAASHSSAAAAVTPGTASAPPATPLAGKVVGIDPGHNGANGANPSYINQLVWNGRAMETCDTTGTATNSGYTEAQFNFNLAQYLRADLLREGARVVMTRTTSNGIGPCVNTRAAILNNAHADVAIDIHADGGPAWGRGFTVLEPIADGPNNNVIGSSVRFGNDVLQAMLRTSMPVSNYYGQNGIAFRSDLAGLNLATEPKILIECGNMRNATDAQLLTSTTFQKQLAAAFAAAITRFLTHP